MRPSGPAARELPLFRMAREVYRGVKGAAVVSSGRVPLRRRFTRRAVGSLVWVMVEENCLLKAMAMSWLRVSVLLLKVMGWFGGVGVLLPESVLRSVKNWEALYLFEHDSTVCIQVCLLVSRISFVIWS